MYFYNCDIGLKMQVITIVYGLWLVECDCSLVKLSLAGAIGLNIELPWQVKRARCAFQMKLWPQRVTKFLFLRGSLSARL